MTIVHASLPNVYDPEPTPDQWDALVRECNEAGWSDEDHDPEPISTCLVLSTGRTACTPDCYEDEAPELSWDAEFDPDTEWLIDRLADDFEPTPDDRVWLSKQRGADEDAPDYHKALTVSTFDYHQDLID